MKRLLDAALAASLIATSADALSCHMGPFIVFFESDSAALNPEASSILDNTAGQAKCGDYWWPIVKITGFTDRAGPTAHNLILARGRAENVKAYLISRGVPARLIVTEAIGEDEQHLRIPTADGIAEIQNRRVEVTFDSKPES